MAYGGQSQVLFTILLQDQNNEKHIKKKTPNKFLLN